MENKLKIKANKKLSELDPTGSGWFDMIDVETWSTEQVYRYKTRVVWKHEHTGEIVIVEMEDEEASSVGKTDGLTSAKARMAKTGKPCGGGRNWEKSDYKEGLKEEIIKRRAKPDYKPEYLLDDPSEDDSEGGE